LRGRIPTAGWENMKAMAMDFQRPLLNTLLMRMEEPRKFIQVLAGSRQVGKTTVAMQLHDRMKVLKVYDSADDTNDYSAAWIDRIWESLRIRMNLENAGEAILIIGGRKARRSITSSYTGTRLWGLK
jgi:predicted AAA+ superfamily ATPase